MLSLKTRTSAAWVGAVMADFDSFLLDHAACERKASATGLSFVVRYPDRDALVAPMIAFALEELEHFRDVYAFIAARGLRLTPDERDPYVTGFLDHVRTGRDERLLDRLLVAAIVEARGCERFELVARALTDGALKVFYERLVSSEARHHVLFVRLARNYFDEETIAKRLDALLDIEAALLAGLAPRAALH